ncbi:hypothetical protein I547_7698 [Mycobacterium kansasii 824]|nr:hypothetical protein I547_7698 [Mycobacterium kansasii 824]
MDDVEAFAEHLVVLGRSSYTVRSYRLGVGALPAMASPTIVGRGHASGGR